jgi:hypothetical protein
MPSNKPNLADLASAAGSTRVQKVEPAPTALAPVQPSKRLTAVPPSRRNTVPITYHGPEEVRDQLKMLALKQKRPMNELQAEAFNNLFASYGVPEIAPVAARKSKKRS